MGLVDTPGKLNYLITLVLLRSWNMNPCYNMIHILRKDFVTDPKHSKLLNKLRSELADRFDVADIYTASAEAFYEFRFRIGTKYEALKCLENSDLPQYAEASKMLSERLQIALQEKQSKEIIIPTGK